MKQSKFNERETPETLRARLKIGVLLLILWLIFIGMAAVTFPFVEHTTRMQNVGYGIVVGIPFLLIMALYFRKAIKDLSGRAGEE